MAPRDPGARASLTSESAIAGPIQKYCRPHRPIVLFPRASVLIIALDPIQSGGASRRIQDSNMKMLMVLTSPNQLGKMAPFDWFLA
jgi:hypothetical protein